MYECPNKLIRAIIVGDDEDPIPDDEIDLAVMNSVLPKTTQSIEAHFSNMELPH